MQILQNLFIPRLIIKITDETNSNLERLIEPLLNELLKNSIHRKLRGKEIEIIIPQNFSETVYKWACKEEKDYFDEYGYALGMGHFSTPLDNESRYFKVIIDQSTFQDFQYFSTLTHELIHVLDFNAYIKKYGNPVFMDENQKNKNYYYEFYYWTEFHAKKIGLERLIEELDKYDKKIDLVRSATIFQESVNQRSGRIGKLYELMHFYARITASKNVILKNNQSVYPTVYINSNFGRNATVIHFVMEEIENFKDFEKQKILLKHLFNGDHNYFC